ncbi:MAG: hypothetical protein C0608_10740 [Deltaproteobacteria bacterium]|nr:MAG: hypothetical protein C0608_10740 [Deltaproteobacteria bacterium]
MRKSFITLITLALFALPSIASAGMGGGALLAAGEKAPDFNFKDLKGVEGSLYKEAEGKPLLLLFVQRTCRSCQREMDFLGELKAENPDLNVFGVFVDAVARDFDQFLAERNISFRFMWDAEYEIADMFGVSFTPTSFLLDGDRKVSKVYRGWSKKGEKLASDFKEISDK